LWDTALTNDSARNCFNLLLGCCNCSWQIRSFVFIAFLAKNEESNEGSKVKYSMNIYCFLWEMDWINLSFNFPLTRWLCSKPLLTRNQWIWIKDWFSENKNKTKKSFTVLIKEHFNQAGWIRRSTSCFLLTNKNPS